MSTTLRRGTRLEEPTLPSGSIELQPPPELAPNEGIGGALMMALPMLGGVGAIIFVAAAGGGAGPTRFIAAGMFLVAMLGFVAVSIDRQRKQRTTQMAGQRREYLQYLATIRRQVRAAADQQRTYLLWNHPAPASLPALAEDSTRLWDRGADSDDLLHVRYGLAPQPLALDLLAPEAAPVDQLDPVAAAALHRLIAVHQVQPSLPAALDLRAFARVEITGEEDPARATARALVAQAVAFQSPAQLLVAVLCDDDTARHWEWVKWLPHAQSPTLADAVGQERMVSGSVDDLLAMLPSDLLDRPRFGAEGSPELPHVLLVVDGGELPPGNHLFPDEGVHGMTLVDLPEQWDELHDPQRLRLGVDRVLATGRAALTVSRFRTESFRAEGDQMSTVAAEALARRLAPLYAVDGPRRDDTAANAPELVDLLGLGELHELDLATLWEKRPERDRLRVPIGVSDTGAPAYLDLKESAQQGMGPHGLVIGATGSGKSEFLRTLVLGLLMTHSPETLNMVLVDFKGGATFAGLTELPHVSAVITNLEDELTLVDRMQDALSGEMVRRQEILRRAGNYASVRDYERARVDGADLEPLPSLFIVVDEFSEMLAAKPEFLDLFVAIGRLGRSLGLHLLLASQRLEEGRLRGLESHLSYRIGLRTFSAQESRTVLGVPDAYELPSVPGLGYLKPDPTVMLRFKASYVSGQPPRRRRRTADDRTRARAILPFGLGHVLAPTTEDPEASTASEVAEEQPDDKRSTMEIAVAQMIGRGQEAHRVWLPPLDVPDTLGDLLGELDDSDKSGLTAVRYAGEPGGADEVDVAGALRVPVGIVDRPREQRRDNLEVDLAGASGHVAVVGGPRSGKSTLLRSLVGSLALTSTPARTHFYVLDFGGGTFAPWIDLPHVSGTATRSEPDVVRRIAAEVTGIVDRRERYFRNEGIDSIETYRTRRSEGTADDGYGDVFLVVDGWGTLRSDFDELEGELTSLAQRGLTYGLHMLVSTPRWADFRAPIRDILGTRLELRLGDPADSEIDRKSAAMVPTGRAGRGLVSGGYHFLGALPRIDAENNPQTLGAGTSDLVSRIAKAWEGPLGPKLRLLPERIDLAELLGQASPGEDDRRLHLAIDERDLAPVGLDLDLEPHLRVYGDAGSGKSALLRSYVQELVRTRGPDEAKIMTVDYRRSLLGEVPDDYALGYLTNASQAAEDLPDLATYLTSRLPGPEVTAEQLRARSWWEGPELFLLVDDYDLVSAQGENPLAQFVPLLPQGRDVGLHVVLARRAGGASRAFDNVLQSLGDLDMPGLLLSGNPDEGRLIGRASPRPMVPGRAQLVTRDRGIEIVHLAWSDPVG